MTDGSGLKYELNGVRYATNEAVNAALAAHLGLDALPQMGKHGGEIVLLIDGKFVRMFTYTHEDGVDKIVPV